MAHLTSDDRQSFCQYYQAQVKKEDCWFFVAILKSFEHVAFDRTIDKSSSLFEFFVPQATERYFLKIMAYFQEDGTVYNLKKLPNRLLDPAQKL